MSQRLPIVLIEWIDAENSSGWETIEDAIGHNCPTIHSAGFLLKESKSHTTLAVTVGEPDACGVMRIPRGMIVKKTTLRRAKKR